MWVGTPEQGLNRKPKDADKFVRMVHDDKKPDSLSNDAVFSLFEDASGAIWVGTENGLNRFDTKTSKFTRLLDGVPINGITETPDKALWLATRGNGVIRLDPATGAQKEG